jgi:stress-induced morphogen
LTLDRVKAIETCLTEYFRPLELRVKDQSHLHAGHAGAKDGRGHFDVNIVAELFKDVPPLRRHQMVYDALGNLMQTDIHALRISAKSPDERQHA